MPKMAFGELKNGGIRICKCGVTTLEDEMHYCLLDKMEDETMPKESKKENLQEAVDDALVVFVDTQWYQAYKHLGSKESK